MRNRTTKSTSFKEDYQSLQRKQQHQQSTVSRYRSAQRSVFAFFERPQSKISVAFHVLSFTLIFASIVMSILSTVDDIQKNSVFEEFILYFELSLLSWFSFEYIARMWSCASVSKFNGFWGRLRFARTFYMLLDAFVILSTLTTTILHLKDSYFTMLRITRFLQVFRILRVDRQRGDLMTMGRVVFKHRNQMLTCYFVGFIILLGGAYVVYIVEKSAADPTIDNKVNQNSTAGNMVNGTEPTVNATITNMVDGIYWAMITVTSVGYGDMSPVTWAGKIIAGLFAVFGCAFFSLPAWVLGSGFAITVAKQKREIGYTKLRNPAAIVIQTLWRNHALNEKVKLQGTWNIFDVKILPKKKISLAGIKRPTRKLGTYEEVEEDDSESSPGKPRSLIYMPSWERTPANNESKLKIIALKNANDKLANFNKKGSVKGVNSEVTGSCHKIAVRFIMRLKFLASIHSFKQFRHPFVGVEDIMEKVCRNHSIMVCQLRDINKVLEELKAEINGLNQSVSHAD